MFPNHYMDVRVGPENGSVAYFSRHPKRKLALFVHGFGGDAIDTWKQMNQLLPFEESAADYDLVFYGYRSMRSRAELSAGRLRQFLSDMNDPNGSYQSNIPDERIEKYGRHEYRNIVVIAHSLGAAVARRVVLDASKEREPWLRRAKLVLFAPAHCGASVARLAFELKDAGRFFSALATMAKLAVPVLDDLTTGSRFLTKLREETTAICGKQASPPFKAAMVIIGDRDQVVEPEAFCSDPVSRVVVGKGHINVCKVSSEFRDPLALVVRHL